MKYAVAAGVLFETELTPREDILLADWLTVKGLAP